jgi:hypothetical protein
VKIMRTIWRLGFVSTTLLLSAAGACQPESAADTLSMFVNDFFLQALAAYLV